MRQIKVYIKPRQERLDKYLAANIKLLSRSKIQKLIKEGFVLVNDRSASPDYKIKRGDTLKIEIPPPKPTKVSPEAIPLSIVYEDPHFLVIDKEAGMVVHPTTDHPGGTLVNAILYHLKKVPGMGETTRPGIVHRLDKDTSGLLVVAKTQKALEDLKSQFKGRQVSKKYLALVGSRLQPPTGTIDKPIGRHSVNRKKFTVSAAGKEAVTNYKVIEYLASAKRKKGAGFTLVEVEPKTGRTHQIRVHLSSIGNPILGDRLYGGRAAPRLFLHATYLELTHPKTGKRVSFESPLPASLEKILLKIKN